MNHYLDTGQMRNFLGIDRSKLAQPIETVLSNRQLGPNGPRPGARVGRTGMCFKN